jgi:hypothetical protein
LFFVKINVTETQCGVQGFHGFADPDRCGMGIPWKFGIWNQSQIGIPEFEFQFQILFQKI